MTTSIIAPGDFMRLALLFLAYSIRGVLLLSLSSARNYDSLDRHVHYTVGDGRNAGVERMGASSSTYSSSREQPPMEVTEHITLRTQKVPIMVMKELALSVSQRQHTKERGQ